MDLFRQISVIFCGKFKFCLEKALYFIKNRPISNGGTPKGLRVLDPESKISGLGVGQNSRGSVPLLSPRPTLV